MQLRQWGNEYRTTRVCIDSYENQVPVGRIYNLFYPDVIHFHGVMDFLKKMEAMLDQMNFPHAFSSVRTFAKAPVAESRAPHDGKAYNGEVATLALRVLFRQNTSWQGSVAWLEGKREESFRSVLELLFLMDSAAMAGDVGSIE